MRKAIYVNFVKLNLHSKVFRCWVGMY